MLSGSHEGDGVQTDWQSEEIWREALWTAREQLRWFVRDGLGAKIIYRQRRAVERIRARGRPGWQERVEWAGFSYPPEEGAQADAHRT